MADHFQFPLNITWVTTQSFDQWNSDFWGLHLAEDVVVRVPAGGKKSDTELPVHAAGNGRVKHVGYHNGYGWVVLIEHILPGADPVGPTVTTLYAHLRLANLISNNVDVNMGDIIGHLSSDQNENGGYPFTHIHFGIRKGPVLTNSTCHPITKWWSYAGYSALFEKCNIKSTLVKVGPTDTEWASYQPIHTAVVGEWLRPSTFVNDRITALPGVTTFNFTGTVTIVTDPNGTLGSLVAVGAPVAGTFSYEMNAVDSLSADPVHGRYTYTSGQTNVSVVVTTQNGQKRVASAFPVGRPLEINITNDGLSGSGTPIDSFSVWGFGTQSTWELPIPSGSTPIVYILVGLIDALPPLMLLASDTLPVTLDLSRAQDGYLSPSFTGNSGIVAFGGGAGGGFYSIDFRLTSLTRQ
ncbi:MAG: M23 family metallopeptidase [Bryobacteraceae bacterium]|nr:M23 family metallopeptidase [Bryobacteraceae bacterium]